jgi:flavin reductase (DIM6/NTAB) family NADH-FMN oxidoreductase RutF
MNTIVTQDMKHAMACFGTGVTVITTHHAGQDWGMTCNSFNTVSLEPAMVLWSIRQLSSSQAAFKAASGYTVNILSSAQHALAMRFTKGLHMERFAGVEVERLGDHRPRIVAPWLRGTTRLCWVGCWVLVPIPIRRWNPYSTPNTSLAV